MARVVLEVGHPAHVAALLPVFPWLVRAGATIVCRRRGWRAGWPELDLVAHAIGLPPPPVEWPLRLRVGTPDVLLGTTDDLTRLRARSVRTGARFVAAPRLPVPATLLSVPVAPSLRPSLEEHLVSPAGRLLGGSKREVVPALSRRIDGLPFLLTGSPELALPTQRDPVGAWVVLYPGDLPLDELDSAEAVAVQEKILARVLRPLVKKGGALELRAALGAPEWSSGEALAGIVARVSRSIGLAPEAIRVRPHEGFATLASATAVLVLRERDLWRALVAGAPRVALAAFALEPELPAPSADGVPGWLASAAELGAWIAEDAQPLATETAARVAELLGPLSNRGSGQRVAQAVLSSSTDS